MRAKGRVKYVPPSVVQELESIKKANEIFKDSDGFKDMVRYARIGREIEAVRGKMFPFIEKKKVK